MQKGVGGYVSKENPLTHALSLQKTSLPGAKSKKKRASLRFQKQENFCIAEKILDDTKIQNKGSQELSKHWSSHWGPEISLKKQAQRKNKMKQRGFFPICF